MELKVKDRVQVVGLGGYRGSMGTVLKINRNTVTIHWDNHGVGEWYIRGGLGLEVIGKKCPMALTGPGKEV